jgi:tRNA(Ile2) C34 agmatinyltransferase TiaS
MTGTCAACLHTNQSRSYLNHLVYGTVVKWIGNFRQKTGNE